MGVYMATTEPPRFLTPGNEWRTAVSAGLAGFPEDAIEYGRALRDGRYVEDPAWILVATPTLDDPSRAPEGHHTVKFLVRPVVRLRGAQGVAGAAPARARCTRWPRTSARA